MMVILNANDAVLKADMLKYFPVIEFIKRS